MADVHARAKDANAIEWTQDSSHVPGERVSNVDYTRRAYERASRSWLSAEVCRAIHYRPPRSYSVDKFYAHYTVPSRTMRIRRSRSNFGPCLRIW